MISMRKAMVVNKAARRPNDNVKKEGRRAVPRRMVVRDIRKAINVRTQAVLHCYLIQ